MQFIARPFHSTGRNFAKSWQWSTTFHFKNFLYFKLYSPGTVIIFGKCDHHDKQAIFSKYHDYL